MSPHLAMAMQLTQKQRQAAKLVITPILHQQIQQLVGNTTTSSSAATADKTTGGNTTGGNTTGGNTTGNTTTGDATTGGAVSN